MRSIDRIQPRDERRQLAAIVRRVHHEARRQIALGERGDDRFRIVSDDDDHVLDAGGAERPDDARKECVAVAERQRRFRTSHARRTAGGEHDRGNHPSIVLEAGATIHGRRGRGAVLR